MKTKEDNARSTYYLLLTTYHDGSRVKEDFPNASVTLLLLRTGYLGHAYHYILRFPLALIRRV